MKRNKAVCQCIHCGDKFDPSEEEKANFEEGTADLPRICDDCFAMLSQPFQVDEFSDADPGL